MIATYRLSEKLASFEFFNWLVMVQAAGATEIVLDPRNPKTKKFPIGDRFRSIIEPGPALAGLPSRIGNDPSELTANGSQLLPWFRSGKRFKRLQTVKPAAACKYTVTIRSNPTAKARDSNRDAYIKFAISIGAVVIDDYSTVPIHLHDRVALYAGAEMNFGVCNGPVHMISLTPYPVAMWANTDSARNSQLRWGLRAGEKYPWMLPTQSIIWGEDSFDNLRRVFDGERL